MTEKGYQWGVKALKKRRAEVAGEIAQLKLQVKAKIQDLAAVDRVLQVLAPDSVPAQVPSRRNLTKYANIFRQGQLNTLLLGILKASGRPMTAGEILAILMQKLGATPGARESLRKRTNANLHYLLVTNRIEKPGQALWALRKDEERENDSPRPSPLS